MSDSNATVSSSSTTTVDDNVSRGYSIVYRALDLLGFGIAVACAWSCSSLVMGTIMFIVMAVVMALLSYAAKWLVMFSVSPDRMNTIGGMCDVSRFTNMFKRAAPAAPATTA